MLDKTIPPAPANLNQVWRKLPPSEQRRRLIEAGKMEEGGTMPDVSTFDLNALLSDYRAGRAEPQPVVVK